MIPRFRQRLLLALAFFSFGTANRVTAQTIAGARSGMAPASFVPHRFASDTARTSSWHPSGPALGFISGSLVGLLLIVGFGKGAPASALIEVPIAFGVIGALLGALFQSH